MSSLQGGSPPQDRDQLLAQAGAIKAKIYTMVRTILDDLEAVAPWDSLYYPPTDAADFLSMELALVAMIEDIPMRVGALTKALMAGELDDAARELVDNADFYFHGIGVSVSSELEKLRAKLDAFKASSSTLTSVERTFICEISADLKGKYTSSIMGAAASLLAEGLWNGVEIEPILFPEKAEEFDRNEKLVARLSQVTETIQGFLAQVPLAELVASWRQQRRVDQYALAPLYSLLGDLGQLMQVSSRRALYSGDYHQIQQREVQLSSRINELTSLHSMTWRTIAEADRTGDGVYGVMVEKAVELAAILDLEILKKVIGGNAVKDLFFIVTMEKEDDSAGKDDSRKAERRKRIPEELHSLISLLCDEDLKTFLELLLGSVLKRASLTVQRQDPVVAPPVAAPPVAAPPVAAPGGEMPTPAAAGAPAGDDESFVLEPPELLMPDVPPEWGQSSAPPAGPPSNTSEDPVLTDAVLSEPPVEFDFSGFDLDAPAGPTAVIPPPTSTPEEAFPPPEEAWAQMEPPDSAWPPPAEVFPANQAPPAEVDPAADRIEALKSLLDVLQPLLSRGSSNRKSFELVRRLLKQKRAIPSGLLQSMRPYLYEVMNQLIPQLRDDTRLGDSYADYGTRLFGHCQVLCDPTLSPESGLTEVPVVMEQVLDLLNRLAITTRSSIERLAS